MKDIFQELHIAVADYLEELEGQHGNPSWTDHTGKELTHNHSEEIKYLKELRDRAGDILNDN